MADDGRRQNTQTIAWFLDLHRRELLDLDPPYQRRSVWSQSYKDFFIDTILLNYPAPAVFLFEDISEEGIATYSVVDGKQRLSTIFDFVSDTYPVSDRASTEILRGKYFSDLLPAVKKRFYSYQFSIEFLPSTDEGTLNNIFDRINRNVSRLTPQELRHARFDGAFATSAERLATHLEQRLARDFPRIAPASRRQMKDVELAAQLLLLSERGVESHSQNDLDVAYSERDEDWLEETEVQERAERVIEVLCRWGDRIVSGPAKRLRNQADFYSLFGAILRCLDEGAVPDPATAVGRLEEFIGLVSSDEARVENPSAARYYEAARSASNDRAQRRDRINLLYTTLTGRS